MLAVETISDFIALIALLGIILIFDAAAVVADVIVLLRKVISEYVKTWFSRAFSDSLISIWFFFEIVSLALPFILSFAAFFFVEFVVAIMYIVGKIERELYTLIFMPFPFLAHWIQLPCIVHEASKRCKWHFVLNTGRFTDASDHSTEEKVLTTRVILDAHTVKAAIARTDPYFSFIWTAYELPKERNKADIVLGLLKNKKRAVLSYARTALVLNFVGWNNLRNSKGEVSYWGWQIFKDSGPEPPTDLTAESIEVIIKGKEGSWRSRRIRVLFESEHEEENESSTENYRYRLDADETARICRSILQSHYSLHDVMKAHRIIVNRWMRLLRYLSMPIIYLLTQAAWTGSDDGLFDITINQEKLAFRAFQLAVVTLWLKLGFPRLVGDEFTTVDRTDFDNLPSETRDKIILSMSCGGFRHLLDPSTGWWTGRPDLLHYTADEVRKPILGMSTYDFALAGIVREEGEGIVSAKGEQLIKVKHIWSGREAYIFKDRKYFEIAPVSVEQPENAEPEPQV